MVQADERSGPLAISTVIAKEEYMSTGHAGVEEAVLNMLRRYKVLRIEDLSSGLLDFSWSQLILAIDRLSRKNMIALRRVGLSYQIRPINQEWTLGQGQQHEEPPAHHR
jgi:predicted transcriptional regulator